MGKKINLPTRLVSLFLVLIVLCFLPFKKAWIRLALLATFLFFINIFFNKNVKKNWLNLGRFGFFSLPFTLFLFIINWLFSSLSFFESFLAAIDIGSRLFLGLLTSWIFILNQPAEEIVIAVNQIVPFPLIANLISLGLRYMQIFLMETLSALRAKKARQITQTSIKENIRLLVLVVEKIILRSFDRAEFIYAAMTSRGYTGRFYFLEKFPWSFTDFIFLLVLSSTLLILILL
ncbi:MAG: energy-coupling factor transporter transmembrane protein EcfT [Candidatus Aminicenantes bacterium]|nr:energy-coupling factor transporter transmembrane protein EcfT [Candidatus Aminicenantes bacterium]